MMTQHDFSKGACRPPPGRFPARGTGAIETWLHCDLAARYDETLDETLPADLLELIARLPS